jgi:hypothetical protein
LAEIDFRAPRLYIADLHARRPGDIGPRREHAGDALKGILGRQNLVRREDCHHTAQHVAGVNHSRAIDGRFDWHGGDVAGRLSFDRLKDDFFQPLAVLLEQQEIYQAVF